MENANTDFLAYSLLENYYIELMKKKEEYKFVKKHEEIRVLFPVDWFSSDDYELKIKLLNSAINQNINLKDVPDVSVLSEGIKN